MAIVLQIRRAGSPFQQNSRFHCRLNQGQRGVSLQFGILQIYSQNWSLERGLACIVQSWFFCFLLALPSPFPSCADVKGCEVTAWGRCWVGAGRRGGGSAWPSCPSAEFLLHLCCLILQRFHRGHIPELKINYSQKRCRNH